MRKKTWNVTIAGAMVDKKLFAQQAKARRADSANRKTSEDKPNEELMQLLEARLSARNMMKQN